MQFFTANKECPRDDIGRHVLGFRIAVAEDAKEARIVTDAIDDASCPEGNPEHLNQPNQQTRQSEEKHVNDEH